MRRTVTVIGVLGALVVAACGGSKSSGVSASSYVKNVCTAVNSWASDIQAKSGALNVASIANAEQGKTAIKSFFASAVTDTDAVINKLRAAGSPDVSNGSKISGALVTSFTQIQTALKKGQTQAAALPTADPSAFKTAGAALGNSVQTSLNGIGQGLSGLKSADLEKAANSEPACKSLS